MEEEEKSVCKVCCSVCSCVHNRNGCSCNRDGIKISENDKSGHFCDSYECKCGFRN